MERPIRLIAALALGITACASDAHDPEPSTAAKNETQADDSAEMLTFRTDPVQIGAGQVVTLLGRNGMG